METDGRLSALRRELEQFVEALKATPQVRRLAAAERRVQGDPEVQRLEELLRAAADAYRRGQADGTLHEEEVRRLREIQAAYQEHPAVRELFGAQMEVALHLRAVNSALSDILGLDFAQMVRSTGGCC